MLLPIVALVALFQLAAHVLEQRQPPQRARTLKERAQLFRQVGQLEEAAQALEEASELLPEDVQARVLLAYVRLAQGRPDEAERVLREVLASRPQDPAAAVPLARLLLETGRPLDAAEVLEPELGAIRKVTDPGSRFPPNVPNVIELYLAPGGSTTFSLADPVFAFDYNADWDHSVTNGGYNATLSTDANFSTFNTFPVLWPQGFEQDETTQQTFTVSWREVQYDWVGGVEVGSVWRSADVVAPGGGGPPGVVPEPSTWLILGLGGLAAAARARRRRAAA